MFQAAVLCDISLRLYSLESFCFYLLKSHSMTAKNAENFRAVRQGNRRLLFHVLKPGFNVDGFPTRCKLSKMTTCRETL